jgi:hypothetical protein
VRRRKERRQRSSKPEELRQESIATGTATIRTVRQKDRYVNMLFFEGSNKTQRKSTTHFAFEFIMAKSTEKKLGQNQP